MLPSVLEEPVSNVDQYSHCFELNLPWSDPPPDIVPQIICRGLTAPPDIVPQIICRGLTAPPDIVPQIICRGLTAPPDIVPQIRSLHLSELFTHSYSRQNIFV
jgi:hypothetical protein